MIKYRNLWHWKTNLYGPEFYEHDGRKIATHRGVYVYRNPAGSFDFVIAGACVGMRAGYSTSEGLDDLLDGRQCCSQEVANHLRSNGFLDAISYSEYSAREEIANATPSGFLFDVDAIESRKGAAA